MVAGAIVLAAAVAAPAVRASDCARDELAGPVHTVAATIGSLEKNDRGEVETSERRAWNDTYDRSCNLTEHEQYTTDFVNDERPQRIDATTVVLHSNMGDRIVRERYDGSGALLETRTTAVTGEFIDDSLFTYDASGRVIRIDTLGAGGKPYGFTTFGRDAGGHVIRETIDLGDGRSFVEVSRYEFDRYGNWIKRYDSANDPDKPGSPIAPTEIVVRAITYYGDGP